MGTPHDDKQGAFVRHVLSAPRFRYTIRLVPWYVFQSIHPHPMVHHFIGPPRTKEKHMSAYLRFRGPGGGGGGSGGGGGGGGGA